MSTNSAMRAAAYRDMIDLINQGHIKGALESDNGVCLVGAADKVTVSRYDSRSLQNEILAEILERSPMLRTVHTVDAIGDKLASSSNRVLSTIGSLIPTRNASTVNPDGGLWSVEMWNDTPWRRTSAVVEVLSHLADKYAAEAREELIAELTATVAELKRDKALLLARVSELEAEVARLRQENGILRQAWNARRARVSAQELRDAHSELGDIENHLADVLAQVQATQAVV